MLFVAITKSDMMDILTNNSPLPRLTFDNGHLRWLETNVIEALVKKNVTYFCLVIMDCDKLFLSSNVLNKINRCIDVRL